MNSEKITYVKPTALELGPVSPIYGGGCYTGLNAAGGCATGSLPGPSCNPAGSVANVCSYGDGLSTR